MATEFKDLFASMLKDLDNGKSVEEIIASAMEKEGLSEASKENVNQAVNCVDKINKANEDLSQARKEGLSREEWLEQKIEDTIDTLPEDLKVKAKEAESNIINKVFENLQK